jgi:hypothetical protein
LLVGKQDAYEYVEALYLQVSDDRRVHALDMESCLASAKHAYTNLKNLRHEIDRWTAKEWHNNRTCADETVKEYQGHFTTLLDYARSIQSIVDVKKGDTKYGERNKRRKKAALAQLFLDGGCPPKLAGLVAEFLDKYVGADRYCSHYANASGSAAVHADEWDGGAKSRPKGFIALHGGTNINGPTYHHRELQKMFVETKDMNDGKMERARVDMETHPSTHLVSPCLSAVDEQKLVVNDPTPTTPLTFINAVKRSNPIHIVQLAYNFSVRFESAPLIGVGSFFVVTHGYGVVVFSSSVISATTAIRSRVPRSTWPISRRKLGRRR